jgi:hypothetical protein
VREVDACDTSVLQIRQGLQCVIGHNADTVELHGARKVGELFIDGAQLLEKILLYQNGVNYQQFTESMSR